MKASHRRILRWVLGILAVVVLAIAFVVANIAAQIGGGWDEVLDRSNPTPTDPQVVAAREVAGRLVDEEIARVVGDVVVPTLTGGRVAQRALTGQEAQTDRGVGVHSGCEVGFHDWKRDDPYDLLCVEIRRAVVAADEAVFRTDMAALDRALLADGWRPREELSGLPASLERAEEDARLTGKKAVAADVNPAAYMRADGEFALLVSFQSIEAYTGRPMPELDDDEYAAMVSVSRESVRE